jgi:hypothetical protein
MNLDAPCVVVTRGSSLFSRAAEPLREDHLTRLTHGNPALLSDESCPCSPRRNREKTTGGCFGSFPRIYSVFRGGLCRGTKRFQKFSGREWLRSWLLAWDVARIHPAVCVRRFAFQRQGHHLRGAQHRHLVQPRLSLRCRHDMGRRRSLHSTSLTRRRFCRVPPLVSSRLAYPCAPVSCKGGLLHLVSVSTDSQPSPAVGF